MRKKRWAAAFSEASAVGENSSVSEDVNRKATIVIEHIIQASDVAHTMQHWHVYRGWNEKLFEEMYVAYKTGRAAKDPSEGWYKGELWFFDNYVIPLAKKLASCGVFGVSSDECLSYAQANRDEWSVKGVEVVAEMSEKYSIKYADTTQLEQLPASSAVSAEKAVDNAQAKNRDSNKGASKNAVGEIVWC